MATVQMKDDRTYGKAIELMLELGGLFQTRHPRKLMIGPGQIQALRDAGLQPKLNGATKHGQKEVRYPPHNPLPPVIIIPNPSHLGEAQRSAHSRRRTKP